MLWLIELKQSEIRPNLYRNTALFKYKEESQGSSSMQSFVIFKPY
jgi:hypothetical protein